MTDEEYRQLDKLLLKLKQEIGGVVYSVTPHLDYSHLIIYRNGESEVGFTGLNLQSCVKMVKDFNNNFNKNKS